MDNERTASNEAEQIVEDAQSLLSATADIAEAKVVSARKRLAAALQSGKEMLATAKEKAVAGAKATDTSIREHPYQALGIALGVGLLVGYLVGRRNNNN